MESYSYASSYPDSSDSSPPSRDLLLDGDATTLSAAAASWENNEPPPPSTRALVADSNTGRVKLMISYGGRIQPRPHDNQLSYVGGETKILAVDRAIRFSAILLRHAALSGAASADDLCFKYQLPGEDLDALISVTNDEDLDHMMLEYDRLQQLNCNTTTANSSGGSSGTSSSRLSGAKPSARLRLFLFPLGPPPPPPSAALLDPAVKPDRQWFVDALNSIQPPPVTPAANDNSANASPTSPDFLFGFDNEFVHPPDVKVKNPAKPDPSPVFINENFPTTVEKPDLAVKEGRLQQLKQIAGSAAVVPHVEIQRQIQELDRLQLTENQQQLPPPPMQRNGSEETLTRICPPEYYLPRVQEKAPQPLPPAFWPEQRSLAVAPPRYASVAAGGDQAVYLIPAAAAGVFPGAAGPGQGYYAAMPRMMPAEVYREAAVYAVPPTQPSATATKVVGSQYPEAVGGGGAAAGYAAVATAQVAYDSAGRAVYLAGAAVPTYQTVTSVALNPAEGVKVVKPSQVS